MIQMLLAKHGLVQFVVYLLGAFSLIAFLFILATILFRMYHIVQFRRRERLHERFNKLLFEYLDNPEDERVLQKLKLVREKEELFQFLIHYMELLKGGDREKILDLMVFVEIPIYLMSNLRHRNHWRRAYAAYFLGVLRFEPATEALERALKDKSHLVQFYAAKSLIQIDDFPYLRIAILHLFRIPRLSGYLLMEGLMELSEQGMEIALTVFREAGFDESEAKIFVDLFAYKKYTAASEDILVTLAGAQNRELRIACIRALGILHYKPAIEILRLTLGDPDWVIRSQTLRALGRIGDLGALPDFLENLKSENFWVRYDAALALFDLGSVGIDYLKKVAAEEGHPGCEIARQILAEHETVISE